MKIVVLGATGKTGQIVVNLLLEHQHQVTAYVRDSKKIHIEHPNLYIIQGNLDDHPSMLKAFRDKDALISCLGMPSPRSKKYIHPFAETLKLALEEAGIRRIIYLAAAGVHHEVPGILGKIIDILLKPVLTDHRHMLSLFMDEMFEYTIFRPVLLTNGKYKKKYKRCTHGIPGIRPISRQNVAHCLVEAAEKRQWIKESIGLSG